MQSLVSGSTRFKFLGVLLSALVAPSPPVLDASPRLLASEAPALATGAGVVSAAVDVDGAATEASSNGCCLGMAGSPGMTSCLAGVAAGVAAAVAAAVAAGVAAVIGVALRPLRGRGGGVWMAGGSFGDGAGPTKTWRHVLSCLCCAVAATGQPFCKHAHIHFVARLTHHLGAHASSAGQEQQRDHEQQT
jgi:hypothetical protein